MIDLISKLGRLDHPWLLVVLVLVSFPVYRLYSEGLFLSRREVGYAFWYWLMPNWIHILRGDWWDDTPNPAFKLFLFLVLSIATVAAEYVVVTEALKWLT